MSHGSTKESLPSPTGRNMALFFLSSQDSTFEANVPGRRMVHGIPRERNRCSLSWCQCASGVGAMKSASTCRARSEEHTSELQSHLNLVCRLLLEKKKI